MMCGTMGDYRRGCRCVGCKAANAERVRLNRTARLADPSRLSCGQRSAYDAGCRCVECKAIRSYIYCRDEGKRPHRWRNFIMEHYAVAREAWWRAMEDATALWDTEVREYREINPGPTLKQFLIFNRGAFA